MAYENKPIPPLTDTDVAPSGKYKGTRLIDIPAKYLLYVYENDMCNQRMAQYIRENLEVITEQSKKE